MTDGCDGSELIYSSYFVVTVFTQAFGVQNRGMRGKNNMIEMMCRVAVT